MSNFHVIYLTGPPASGKSTLAVSLRRVVPGTRVFEYGSELTKHANSQAGTTIRQRDLRFASAGIVSPEDVVAVDNTLLSFVRRERDRAHIIIDTHAVTREGYGFRITPFSLERFKELNPTQIWFVYAHPDVLVNRITTNADGRHGVDDWEAGFHTTLQASVAATYAMSIGIPAYLLDNTRDLDETLKWMQSQLQSGRSTRLMGE